MSIIESLIFAFLKLFSEFGNVLAFGYRLPQKSYAIFRLPAPPANPAQAGVIVINLLFSSNMIFSF
jgi:hypothetical protein